MWQKAAGGIVKTTWRWRYLLSIGGVDGLEPATPGVTGRHSNQLNYHPVVTGRTGACKADAYQPSCGGDDGVEPPTFCLVVQTLYQLS